MKPPHTVLFDLDGTLIDSVPLILESFEHTFRSCDLPVPPRATILQGIGTPLRFHFGRYTDDPDLVARLVDVYRTYNLAHHDARVRAFPGVRAMLDDLRVLGVRMAIVTSKNRPTTRRGLAVSGLDGFFDLLVTADDVTRPKPHPEPVERGLTLLGADPGDSVFVGDSLHDLHSGRAAGVRTAAALWGPFTEADLAAGAPDYWISSPSALPRALHLSEEPALGSRP